MKEFNLKLAKEGFPVCTRDGRKARIICYNAKTASNYNIIALIKSEDGFEYPFYFRNNGECNIGQEEYDLMMSSVKHKSWIVVYKIGSGYKVEMFWREDYALDFKRKKYEDVVLMKYIEWED